MSDKHFVGRDLTGFENNGKTPPVSRVTLMIDDENGVTAGDDTGYEIVADCPHATQEMADAILSKMKGYQYQMYTADAANIDPAAELGDGITADGVYGVISRLSDDGGGYPDITGPGEAELEDEFPMGEGPMTREINRKLGATRSLITKTAEQIRLEVSKEVEGLSSSFTVQLETITGRIDGLDGKYTEVKQAVDGVTTTIQGLNGDITEVKTTLDGLTVTDGSGTTRIKGSSIETGSLVLTGSITWDDLNDTTKSTINSNKTRTFSDTPTPPYSVGDLYYDSYGYVYRCTTSRSSGYYNYWDWTQVSDAGALANSFSSLTTTENYQTVIDGTKIKTGTVTANKLQGQSVQLLTSGGLQVGSMTITDSYGGYGIEMSTNENQGGMRFVSDRNIWFTSRNVSQSGGESSFGLARDQSLYADAFWVGIDACPSNDNQFRLGYDRRRWMVLYAGSSEIVTSDATRKHDIEILPAQYVGMFDQLDAIRYKFDDGTSGRYHVGFTAQDVYKAMQANGISDMDFAGYVKGTADGDTDIYSLRYEEFIGLLWAKVKQLDARVKELTA